MDRMIISTALLSVLQTALCFNIDPQPWWKKSDNAAGFGYQVVQRQSDFLISAPLELDSPNRRGKVFKCDRNKECTPLDVDEQDFAVNMSLGLTMISDPDTQNIMACGPTIPKDCKTITMYNGMCFQLNSNDRFGSPLPSSLEDCGNQEADIAFLLDGSGSVSYEDFQRMKTFVKNLVKSFRNTQQGTQFAVVQFSHVTQIHYYFNTFFTSGSWERNINNIYQLTGGTYTAKAITDVVQNIFTPDRGSRSDVKKILIVITDGESNDPRNLPNSVSFADRQNIIRFAIGVGDAFKEGSPGKQELNAIGSSPPESHVFRVQGFTALERIKQTLQDKIFSIEGSQSAGESLKMEMSQQGFSAVYVPGGVQMAVVGANEWRGGYMEYKSGNLNQKSFQPLQMEPDSYLGYSMAVAKIRRGRTLTLLGAPRYNHRGAVVTVYKHNLQEKIDPFPWQFQTGEYFGAVICAMDINSDGYTDVILISAPMYKDDDREGRVYVCTLFDLSVDCQLESPSVLRGVASQHGRFGSSLAVLPDLNTDGLKDLAVGAPLEDDGQGSLYIFHGEGGGRISATYSQRIAGSEMKSGLKFFGMSISQSSFDQSGDNLPDLLVGSKGTVILLRSKPIVMVEAKVAFSPNQVPTQKQDCSQPLSSTVQICFIMTRHSTVDTAQAKITYTLTLDATRKPPNHRAYTPDDKREMEGSVTTTLTKNGCSDHRFFIESCPDDALNALQNELKFTFEGLPSRTSLEPSLAQQAETTTFHSIGFEINCGEDNKCVDDLKVNFNFTSSSVVKVGIDDLMNVTVSVENSGENSYNSYVVLTYPTGLSYSKFTSLQGRIECNSLDSEDGLSRGKTECSIDKPIFKSNTKAVFIVSYGIETNSQLERRIFVTANATSENQEHANLRELYKMKEISVKYSIFTTFESSHSYNNFTFGMNDLQKPVHQSIMITNDIRALNFTIVIKVPVKLGDRNIWVESDNLQIPKCLKGEQEEPTIKDFVAQIQKTKEVDCSVARCQVFRCHKFMIRRQKEEYILSANVSSGWIEQIGIKTAKYQLISTATLEYDKDQYIFFSTGSNNNPPIHKIEAEVEVYPEPDFTKEIVGGSLGGLALLVLLTAGLYKAGFFNSKYKQMMEGGAGEGGMDPADDAAIAPND